MSTGKKQRKNINIVVKPIDILFYSESKIQYCFYDWNLKNKLTCFMNNFRANLNPANYCSCLYHSHEIVYK